MHNGILFTLKKEGSFDTCYNLDKPWGHYAKGNKPVTKRQILIISFTWCVKISQIHRNRKQKGGCQGLGAGGVGSKNKE